MSSTVLERSSGPASDPPAESAPPRVAYVISRFPGLSETFILREMEGLRARGWDILLMPLLREKSAVKHREVAYWEQRAYFTPFLSPRILGANLRALLRQPRTYLGLWRDVLRGTWRCPNYLVGALGVFPKAVYLAEVARRAGVQHVHAHYMSHPTVAALVIARLAGIGYSVMAHAHDLYVYQDMLAEKVRGARFVATISDFNRAFIARFAGAAGLEQTHVVRCGVDPSLFTPTPLPTGDQLRILTVGTLRPYKGHAYLVRACALLRDRGLDVTCRIVGEGSLRAALEAEIRALGLVDRITLVGPQPQHVVAEEMRRAHVFALPSVVEPNGKMEGIPVVLMEALASGRAAVATSISGIPELIRDGDTGLLVPPRDPERLADALERLARDRSLAERLGGRGRELVEREFSIETNVGRLERLLRASVAQNVLVAARE